MAMTDFAEHTVLVTGAASGIGRATALAFAELGADVVVADRDVSQGLAVGAEIMANGGRAAFVEVEISHGPSVKAMVERALERFGRLDFAINAAGVEQTSTLLADTDDAEMHRVIDIDLKGTWLCLKHQAPALRARGGAIVNIASFWGEVGMAGGSSYAAAKGGIIALSRAIAAEEAVHGVRVNCVSPGAIRTPMLQRVVGAATLDIDQWAKERTLVGRVAEAAEIAQTCLFLCSQGATYMTGQNLLVDGGYTII